MTKIKSPVAKCLAFPLCLEFLQFPSEVNKYIILFLLNLEECASHNKVAQLGILFILFHIKLYSPLQSCARMIASARNSYVCVGIFAFYHITALKVVFPNHPGNLDFTSHNFHPAKPGDNGSRSSKFLEWIGCSTIYNSFSIRCFSEQ